MKNLKYPIVITAIILLFVNMVSAYTPDDYWTIQSTLVPISYTPDGYWSIQSTLDYTGGDTIAPVVTIILPVNTSYRTATISFNVTLDEGGSWCGYTLDGATNVSMTKTSSTVFDAINTSMAQGSHNVRYFCNDTTGNMNSSIVNQVTFFIDTTPPTIDFVSPTDDDNSIISRNWTYINVTVTDSGSPDNLTSFIDWNNSLIGWWRFDNTTDFLDHSTHSNDCTNNGTTYTTSGKFGGARDFDGIDNYVDCSNDSSMNFGTSDFSFEAWFKNIGIQVATGQQIVVKEYNIEGVGGGWGSEMLGDSGIIDFWTYGTTVFSTESYNDSQWHHIVDVRKDNVLYLYVDAVLVDSDSESSPDNIDNIGNFTIGNYPGIYLEASFNGTIDEVRLWNRALSEEEINASYNTGIYRLYHNFTNLIEGTYTYTAYAQDLAGNVNQTETRTITITIDTLPPTVSWVYPTDNMFTTSWNYSIGFTPHDETQLVNCTLRDNRSGSMEDTVGNTSILVDNSVNTIAETFTEDGSYNVSIKCWDTSSNSAETIGRLFTSDITLPMIEFVLPTPEDSETISTDSVYINVSVSDSGSPNNLTSFINFDNSLKGYWRFNNESGENSTYFKDWSGYGNNCTCTVCVGEWESEGGGLKFGNAIESAYTINDYLTCGNDSSLDITDKITVEAWIKPSDVTSYGMVLAKTPWSGTNGSFVLKQSTNDIKWSIVNGTTEHSTIVYDILSNDNWYHILGTFNGTSIRIYVNGELKNETLWTGTIPHTNNNLIISLDGDLVGWDFVGLMDEIRIHNRVLGDDEIKTSYNGALNRLETNFTSLSEGSYSYTAFTQDLSGNVNSTTRIVTIELPKYILLYLNGSSSDRYYEQGSYTNLTGIYYYANGSICSNCNIWLDIDALGYGINYTTDSSGIVQLDFETFSSLDELYDIIDLYDFETQTFEGWDSNYALQYVLTSSGCSHGDYCLSITSGGGENGRISKHTTASIMIIDFHKQTNSWVDNDYWNITVDGVEVYSSIPYPNQDNLIVNLGNEGIDKEVNITSKATIYTSHYTHPSVDFIRFANQIDTELLFSGNGKTEKTFGWILADKDDISSIKFNITGIPDGELHVDEEDSYICNGTFNPYLPCSRAVDEDITTAAVLEDPGVGDIIEVWYIPPGVNAINFSAKYEKYLSVQGTDSPHSCWNGTDWYVLNLSYPGIQPNIINSSTVPISCFSNSELRVKTLLENSGFASDFGIYIEGWIDLFDIYPKNVSIDINQDGLDNYYPDSYLIGENTFELKETADNLERKNITFQTSGVNTVNFKFPLESFNNITGSFDLTGFSYTVSEDETIFTNSTANISVSTVTNNLWELDITTTGLITSGTSIRFPHGIYLDGGNVHPVKIYNITSQASSNSPVIVTGEKWGGNSSLRVNPTNSSEIIWTPFTNINNNEIYRLILGKNATWDNSTSNIELVLNSSGTFPMLRLNITGSIVQPTESTSTDSCSISNLCEYTCWGSPCLYADCSFGSTSNFCGGSYYDNLDCNANLGTCLGATGTGLLTYPVYDSDSVSKISFRHSYYTYGAYTDYSFYYYNYYSSSYEYISISSIRSWYLPVQTNTNSEKNAGNYLQNDELKLKVIMKDRGSGQSSMYYKPILIYNRSAYQPEIKIGGSSIWSKDSIFTGSENSDELNSYITGNTVLNISSEARYGEILVYFTPFWSSAPENISIKIGTSSTDFYSNNTVFNSTESITIEGDEIQDYIYSECTSTPCSVPFYISSDTSGVLEISNINFTYNYDNIELNKDLITEGRPRINITFYNGNVTIDGINITYFGNKNITVVAHNDDYSLNDTQVIQVVFSNFTIDYPPNIDYWELFPYSATQQNVIPFGGNPFFYLNEFNRADKPNTSVLIKLNESIGCASIRATSTSGDSIIINTSYQNICTNIGFEKTCNISNFVDLACTAGDFYEPVFIFTGKCIECV